MQLGSNRVMDFLPQQSCSLCPAGVPTSRKPSTREAAGVGVGGRGQWKDLAQLWAKSRPQLDQIAPQGYPSSHCSGWPQTFGAEDTTPAKPWPTCSLVLKTPPLPSLRSLSRLTHQGEVPPPTPPWYSALGSYSVWGGRGARMAERCGVPNAGHEKGTHASLVRSLQNAWAEGTPGGVHPVRPQPRRPLCRE